MRHQWVLPALFAICASSASAEPDPAELIRQVQENMSPPDETVEISMRLIEADGGTSQRKAVFYQRRKSPEFLDDMKLIRFSSPPEMDGSAVLTIENADRSDDQWLYLPAYHTSRKIPASNRADRYMGTDFFYEDVTDDKLDEFRFANKGSESLDGRSYIVIEQTAASEQADSDSAYGRKLLWVDPERLIIRRTDFFDKKGTLIKRMESSQPAIVDGRWRFGETRMQDVRIGHQTLISYANRRLNQGVSPRLFTVRSLERGR